ncbi:MAG: cyclic nucleotide-binding domain-containing protein [Myxococcota bacterium]
MSELFDERPRLADDVHVRESVVGPMLFRRKERQSFVLSQTEMAAVACMDGSLTMEAIAAKVLIRHGRTSYAGLVQLYQTLAAAGFLTDPVPRLGVLGGRVRISWLLDLPVLPVPGLGRAAPPLPSRATRPTVLAVVALIAALLCVPALLALLRDPTASVMVAGSWEAAVLALYGSALFASLCRAACRAAWLRAHDVHPTPFHGGLRLRNGLLAFATMDPAEHLRPPAERASLGRAGLLGLLVSAGVLGVASVLLPPAFASAAPYALVPWLVVFLELCPFVPTADGARLLAPCSHTPEARAALLAPIMRRSPRVSLPTLLRSDRVLAFSALWLVIAVSLLLGAPGPATSAWASHLGGSESLPIRIAGAIPFVAWAALGVGGCVFGVLSVTRRVLLALELHRGLSSAPRPSVPDEEADRVLLSMPPLGVLPQTRRRGEAERLVTRVVREGENVGHDAAPALYAVAAGTFRLVCPGAAAITFGPGDVFLGRMRALGADEDADVVAETAGRLRVLGADAVDRLLGEIPEARGALSETLLSRAALRSCAPFAGLPAHAFETLLARADSMVVGPEGVIRSEPHAPPTLFLVRRGEVRETSPAPHGATAGPGDLLGLDSLFDGSLAEQGWVATTRCHLLRIPVRGLADVLQRAAGVGLALEARTLARATAPRPPAHAAAGSSDSR